MANLKQKIAGGITLVGLTFVAAGCNSRGEINPSDVFGFSLQHYGATHEGLTPKQSFEYGMAGDMARTAGQRQFERELAEENRTQVNVYGGQRSESVYIKGRNYLNGKVEVFEIPPYCEIIPSSNVSGRYIIKWPDGGWGIIDPLEETK